MGEAATATPAVGSNATPTGALAPQTPDLLAAGLPLPPTSPTSAGDHQSAPPTAGTSGSDPSQAQAAPASSDAAQAGADATQGPTGNQPTPSPAAAAALAQALAGNGQPAPGSQPAAAPTGSPASSSAAQTTTSPGSQAQATSAQAAASAANAAANAAASQAGPQAPLPASDSPPTPAPGQGDQTKISAAGVKVTATTSSASSATGSKPASGYAAQLVSQQAAAANNAPSNDQPPAEDGIEGTAAATVDGKPASDATKDGTASTNGPSDPKLVQAPALPGVSTDNSQAANVQATATTQAATTSAATATAVIQQVTVHLSKAAVDGIDHINVQLNPPELGHVEVRMEVGPSGHFSAVFSADRPQTADMLQRNAHELTRSLQDAGVRTDAGSLSFNLRGQNQQGNPGWAGGFAGNGARTSTPSWSNGPDEAPAPSAVYANSGIGANRVDIRV